MFLYILGGVPQWKNFAKNGSKGSVTPKLKKSLPFEPEKIALKMIYRRFSLGGESRRCRVNNPPMLPSFEYQTMKPQYNMYYYFNSNSTKVHTLVAAQGLSAEICVDVNWKWHENSCKIIIFPAVT